MKEDENQKLIDEIVLLSKLSNHRLRELTLKLIELYHSQIREKEKIKKNNASFLNQIDKSRVTQHEMSMIKDKMLSQQSKMAIMGDMMDSVAHQWKQPLNSLTMLNDMLVDDFKDETVDEAYITDMTQTSQLQIAHMVNTLSEFRTFFRPSKEGADFFVNDCLESVKILMKDELIKNNIPIEITIIDNIKIYGLINEFKHLFLNLLSNSIDAFNEKDIKTRNIKIKIYKKDDKNIIEFEDNAQGIPPHVIADIFKANVTTKEDGMGTGIGLYMSAQIVKKHNGTLSVTNSNDGAIFRVAIK